MKYMLRGENNFSNPMKTIFKNRKIDSSLFNIKDDVIEDYNGYDNLMIGIELLLKHLKGDSKIQFVIDCDVDGETSSALLWRYILRLFPSANLTYKIHTGKKHGLSSDIEIDDDVDLVILADGLSSDYKEYDDLKAEGKDILLLDHHHAKEYSKSAIVINNQLSKNIKNKNLSGVGVVYKFCRAIDDYLYEYIANDYLDLVALGNVADVMDLKEKETRYLVYEGLKVTNPFIQALIDINEDRLDGKYNIFKIGMIIAPKINGVVRNGTLEECEMLFKAFISDDYEFCLEVANMCKKIKDAQDREVKKCVNSILETVILSSEDRCLILTGQEGIRDSHTGLVAQRLSDHFGVPTLVSRIPFNDEVGGSYRTKGNMSSNLMKDLKDSKLVKFADGHKSAGGWACKIKNIDKLRDYLNNLYKDKEVINGKQYLVDFILQEDEVKQKMITTIGKYEGEWGNKLDKPLIAIENVELNITDDNVKKSFITFKINGVSSIKKFATNVMIESLKNKNVKVNIVASCGISPYTKKGQLDVEDIEVIE